VDDDNDADFGQGLAATDQIILIDSKHRCGFLDALPANIHWAVDGVTNYEDYTYPRASDGAGTNILQAWDKVRVIRQGSWRVCYTSTGSGAIAKHIVNLGVLTVYGPNGGAIFDTKSEESFKLALAGAYNTGSDKGRIRLVDNAVVDVCGKSTTKVMFDGVQGTVPDGEPADAAASSTWDEIQVRTSAAKTLNVCYCEMKATDHTCSKDHDFNVLAGTVTVHPEAKSKKWRLLADSTELETTQWAWAVFDLKLYSDSSCTTQIANSDVVSSRSSNGENGNDQVDDTNLGPVSYALDASTDTFFQTTCGRYTTNTNVQASVINKCSNAATVGADTRTNCASGSVPSAACKTVPYIEVEYAAAKAIKCLKVTQVPTGGARRINTLRVEWSNPGWRGSGDEWVLLKSVSKTSADTGQWTMTNLQ
jgi:hypothetical protein